MRRGRSRIILVDTPGFDDVHKPDIILLEEFVDFLRDIVAKGLQLTGLIYLHRINDTRLQGSARKNLHLLGELCGDAFLPHLVLVTTMWDRIDKEVGSSREDALKSRYWKPFLDKGATSARFDATRKSATDIIDMLLSSSPAADVMLDIQREIICDGKTLAETNAGRSLVEQLRDEVRRTRKELNDLKEEGGCEPQEIHELDGKLQRSLRLHEKYTGPRSPSDVPFPHPPRWKQPGIYGPRPVSGSDYTWNQNRLGSPAPQPQARARSHPPDRVDWSPQEHSQVGSPSSPPVYTGLEESFNTHLDFYADSTYSHDQGPGIGAGQWTSGDGLPQSQYHWSPPDNSDPYSYSAGNDPSNLPFDFSGNHTQSQPQNQYRGGYYSSREGQG